MNTAFEEVETEKLRFREIAPGNRGGCFSPLTDEGPASCFHNNGSYALRFPGPQISNLFKFRMGSLLSSSSLMIRRGIFLPETWMKTQLKRVPPGAFSCWETRLAVPRLWLCAASRRGSEDECSPSVQAGTRGSRRGLLPRSPRQSRAGQQPGRGPFSPEGPWRSPGAQAPCCPVACVQQTSTGLGSPLSGFQLCP